MCEGPQSSRRYHCRVTSGGSQWGQLSNFQLVGKDLPKLKILAALLMSLNSGDLQLGPTMSIILISDPGFAETPGFFHVQVVFRLYLD